MLLIDGVRYELWKPPSEEEFEQVVKEHTCDIFGEQSIYLDRKQKLKSLSGIGSIPDGYAITLGDKPGWHIVEVELSSHPLHEHIVSQVSRFITGIGNPSTQREIARAIYGEIISDGFLKLRLEQAIHSTEIYKFLADLIAEQPILTIIIEKNTPGLREAISTLAHSQIKIVEFQTFTREGLDLAVHTHLFEPVCTVLREHKPPIKEPPPISPRNQLYQQFFNELIVRYCTQYPSQSRVKALPQSLIGFGAGKGGLWLQWAFKSNRKFAVELYIDTGDKAKNKEYFDRIQENYKPFDIFIEWERLDEKKASRVAVYTDGDIEVAMSDGLQKDMLMQWAIKEMKRFSDEFRPIVKALS